MQSNTSKLNELLQIVNNLKEINLQEKIVTENGEIVPDEGYDGLSKVIVQIQSVISQLQEKSLTIKENGTHNIIPDEGYDGLSSLEVVVDVEGIDTSDATATANKILLNETAYANGEKIVGSIEYYLGENSDFVDENKEVLKGLIDGSITEIVIPEGVTAIGKYAFYNYSNLESIEIPSSVTSIGESAFVGTSKLTNIVFKKTLDDYFKLKLVDCNATYATSEAVVKLINENGTLDVLTEINSIPSDVSTIGKYLFYKFLQLEKVIIPKHIKAIGRSAFHSCSSLTTVEILGGVEYIDYFAFASCTQLNTITLPNTLTNIYSNAFKTCDSLKNITIPASVTNIGSTAFAVSYGGRLTIRFEGTTPPTITSNTFTKGTKLEVPMSAVETYKSATNWSNFADYIVGY